MSSSVVLEPTALASSFGLTTGNVTNVNDGSDATYNTITPSAPWGSWQIFDMDTTTLASGERIQSVGVRLRVRVDNTGISTIGQVRVGLRLASGQQYMESFYLASGASVVEWSLSVHEQSPSGGRWSKDDLDGLQVLVASDGSVPDFQTIRLYQVDLDVVKNEGPVTTITVPSTNPYTETNSLKPKVTFNVTDDEGDLLTYYRVLVHNTLVSNPFDSVNHPPVYDSGDISSNAVPFAVPPSTVTHVIDEELEDGNSYQVYVFVTDVATAGYFGGSSGSDLYPPGDVTEIVIDLDPLGEVPLFQMLDYDDYVDLTIQGRINMLPPSMADMEDTYGVGEDWAAKTNAAVSRQTTAITGKHGSGVLRVRSAAAGAFSAWSLPSPIDEIQDGDTIEIRASVHSTLTRNARVGVRFRNSVGTTISEVYGSTQATTTTMTQLPVLTATVPGSCDDAIVILDCGTAVAANEDVNWDMISMSPSEATQWTRGGGDDEKGIDNLWVDVQRSLVDSGEWESVEGFPLEMSTAIDTAGDHQTQSIELRDYGAPRGAPVQYRTRMWRDVTVDIVTHTEIELYTEWAYSGQVTFARHESAALVAPYTSGRNLDPDFPGVAPTRLELCMTGWRRTVRHNLNRQAVYALNRANAIARSGGRRSGLWSLTFALVGDEQWETFLEFMDMDVLLLQTPYGDGAADQYWVSFIGDVEEELLTSDDMQTNQRRNVSVTAVVVDAP